jgi:hypothetical protein
MNLDDVIAEHTACKRSLRRWLAGAEHLSPIVANPAACAFAGWLATARLRGPALEQARGAHDAFHAAAAQVVALAKTNRAKAGEWLDGEYSRADDRLCATLSRLCDQVAAP